MPPRHILDLDGKIRPERDDPVSLFGYDQPTSLGPLPRDDFPAWDDRFEVILLGQAHAPGGRPTPEMTVSLAVGDVRHQLVVSAERIAADVRAAARGVEVLPRLQGHVSHATRPEGRTQRATAHGMRKMYPDFTATIMRRPDMYFVSVPLMIGAMLVVSFIANLLGLPHRERIAPSIAALVCLFGTMAAVAAITGVLPQGKLEMVNDRLSASMLFRRTRVFDMRQTTITLEQWIGPGSVRGGPMGPMLVFEQGDTQFRVGCYDYEGARLLTPVDVGEWRTREAHGATKCKDFYYLADLLGVQIPRPPGWRLTEVF